MKKDELEKIITNWLISQQVGGNYVHKEHSLEEVCLDGYFNFNYLIEAINKKNPN